MTHTGPMDESEGKLTPPAETACRCTRCGGPMTHQTWDSDDGAFEDSKFTCQNPACGHVRWVDGIDS